MQLRHKEFYEFKAGDQSDSEVRNRLNTGCMGDWIFQLTFFKSNQNVKPYLIHRVIY